jgi:two-component system sensor histidine kinase UhpB
VYHGIRLTVADNGTGFEGAGLRTMSAAVQDAGGTMAIDSTPGTGTAVTVTIPLD